MPNGGCGCCGGNNNYSVSHCCYSSPKCCKTQSCCTPMQCCYPSSCCMPMPTCCYIMSNNNSNSGCCGN
ncbi:PREDICTED: keratin-associated protein 5-10-like [Cariama cristata]|uniref:keratin-associated protein 5-10-like n=1 Tax=Cariama cristata TaxID=54380 RepID=UPI0005209AE2|nr:PREDICTED: keratin-associated protein 5-10-like [Cariama cristata]